MRRYLQLGFLLVVVGIILWTATAIYAALTKAGTSVTDWTAVAQNTIGESGTVSFTGNYAGSICIQAFLDTETAHTGTEFIVQTSSHASSNEDWQDLTSFVGLIGTASTEAITNDPLSAASTTITVADTDAGTYELAGRWIAIEDGTLVNSELIYLTGYTQDTSITCLDGTTNEHAQSVAMFDIALSRTVQLPVSTLRARVVVNNAYDIDGSTLNYKVVETEVTAIQ